MLMPLLRREPCTFRGSHGNDILRNREDSSEAGT
jgi:hypothetical protein